MKKLDTIKTVQLIILLLLSGICFYLIVLKSNVYHIVTDSPELKLVCALLWITLFIGFIFIFIDFSVYSIQKKSFNALDYAVHSDPLAKIANRSGCDEIIEKYIDKDLPENMACVMFLLTSLADTNSQSRTEGNQQIRNFSIILKLASVNICFVGRNGGNVFMAIFEDASQQNIDLFLSRISDKVKEYNSDHEEMPMLYQYGSAFHEDSAKNINELISMAHSRARDSEKHPVSEVD